MRLHTRFHTQLLLVVALLAVLAAAWSEKDHEIFRLRDEVAASEGRDATFYDFMGVKPGASHAELVKAYRKKSKELHPDKAKRSFVASHSRKSPNKKNPGVTVSRPPSDREVQAFVKKATERYATLATVAEVLKGPERDRYDHFLKNGFPRWKGTGYYYSRFRPGLGTVLVGLFVVFGGAAHYGALVVSWKRQVEFVDRYIRHARQTAWGDELGIRGIGGLDGAVGTGAGTRGASSSAAADSNADDDAAAPVNRRQKRMKEKEDRKEKRSRAYRAAATASAMGNGGPPTPTGERKRVVAENGKVLIVDSIGNVFLEEETDDGDKEEFLLDPSEIQRPTMRDTVLYRIPVWTYRKTAGRLFGAEAQSGAAAASGDVVVTDEAQQASTTVSEDEDLVNNIPTPPSSGQEAKKKKKSKAKKR